MDNLYSEAKRLIAHYEAIALTGGLTTRQLLHHMQLCQFVHNYQALLWQGTDCIDAATADMGEAA